MPWMLGLCIVMIPTGFSFFCCMGALRGLSIKHERKRFINFGRNTSLNALKGKYQTLAIAYSDHRDGQVVNLFSQNGVNEASGNLTVGVTFTFGEAKCQEAGLYRCNFLFQTVIDRYLTESATTEIRRLEMYPGSIKCLLTPSKVDFSKQDRKTRVTFKCQVMTTLDVQWVWEFKQPGQDWLTFPASQLYDETPSLSRRCYEPFVSTLTIIVTADDKGSRFRCNIVATDLPGGQGEAINMELEDSSSRKDGKSNEDDVLGFQDALSTTGWVLLALVLIVVFLLLLGHGVYPAFTCINSGVSLRQRIGRWRRWHRRRNRPHAADDRGAARQDETPARTQVVTRTPNRHRRNRHGVPMTVADGSNVDSRPLTSNTLDTLTSSNSSVGRVGSISVGWQDTPGAEHTTDRLTISGVVVHLNSDKVGENDSDIIIEAGSVGSGQLTEPTDSQMAEPCGTSVLQSAATRLAGEVAAPSNAQTAEDNKSSATSVSEPAPPSTQQQQQEECTDHTAVSSSTVPLEPTTSDQESNVSVRVQDDTRTSPAIMAGVAEDNAAQETIPLQEGQ